MFPYRVKYTESDITKYHFFYKNTKTAKHFRTFGFFRKICFFFQKFEFLFCNMYNLYNSFFVILVFLDFFYLYTRIRGGLFMCRVLAAYLIVLSQRPFATTFVTTFAKPAAKAFAPRPPRSSSRARAFARSAQNPLAARHDDQRHD